MPLPVNYTDVDAVVETLPMIGSVSTINSSQIYAAIGKAESVINAAIAKRYSVPVSGNPPVLETIAIDLTLYRLLRRVFTQEQFNKSEWPDTFKRAEQTLEKIGKGSITIVSSAGAIISGRSSSGLIKSNTSGYFQTMHEGDITESFVDPDKIDDIQDERDL